MNLSSINEMYELALSSNTPTLAVRLLDLVAVERRDIYLQYVKNFYAKHPDSLEINWHVVKVLREIGKPNESLQTLKIINRPEHYLWWTNALKNYLALQEYDLAIKCGRKIFDILLRDCGVILPKFSKKTQFNMEYKKGKNNYIAFSLFGANRSYGEGVLCNIMKYKELLPGWIIVVYCDESYHSDIVARIESENCLIVKRAVRTKFEGLFWRYEAFKIKDAFRVLIRDADSLPTVREILAVRRWINSGYRYHIIRDHIEHAELILAGLFGGIAGEIDIKPTISTNLNFNNKWIDQEFLRKNLYKKITHSLYVNDQFYNIESVSERISGDDCWSNENHIGARIFGLLNTEF